MVLRLEVSDSMIAGHDVSLYDLRSMFQQEYLIWKFTGVTWSQLSVTFQSL